jgi:hypothetical protein
MVVATRSFACEARFLSDDEGLPGTRCARYRHLPLTPFLQTERKGYPATQGQKHRKNGLGMLRIGRLVQRPEASSSRRPNSEFGLSPESSRKS